MPIFDEAKYFKPWIGENYASGREGKRVLVLGESHYAGDNSPDEPEWTRHYIQRGIEGIKHKFRTRIAATFVGRLLTTEAERHAFWHSIAFANYIPVSVGKTARDEPSEDMWNAAIPVLAKLLEAQRPDLLLILSHEVWRRVHYSLLLDGRPEYIPNEAGQWRMWRYRYPDGQTMLAAAIKHPSHAFRYGQWHPFVESLLKSA